MIEISLKWYEVLLSLAVIIMGWEVVKVFLKVAIETIVLLPLDERFHRKEEE